MTDDFFKFIKNVSTYEFFLIIQEFILCVSNKFYQWKFYQNP